MKFPGSESRVSGFSTLEAIVSLTIFGFVSLQLFGVLRSQLAVNHAKTNEMVMAQAAYKIENSIRRFLGDDVRPPDPFLEKSDYAGNISIKNDSNGSGIDFGRRSLFWEGNNLTKNEKGGPDEILYSLPKSVRLERFKFEVGVKSVMVIFSLNFEERTLRREIVIGVDS